MRTKILLLISFLIFCFVINVQEVNGQNKVEANKTAQSGKGDKKHTKSKKRTHRKKRSSSKKKKAAINVLPANRLNYSVNFEYKIIA